MGSEEKGVGYARTLKEIGERATDQARQVGKSQQVDKEQVGLFERTFR